MAAVSLALVVGLGGCGGGKLDKERRVCAHVDKLCDSDPEPLDKCPDELHEMKEPAGTATYDRFLDCTLESKSCPEFIGCFVGGFEQVAKRWGQQFERGVDRMRGDDTSSSETRRDRRSSSSSSSSRSTTRSTMRHDDDDPFARDDAKLPTECQRLLDICTKADTIPRIRCRDMARDLAADPVNRAKLGTCINAAKSCYATTQCVDDLFFSLP